MLLTVFDSLSVIAYYKIFRRSVDSFRGTPFCLALLLDASLHISVSIPYSFDYTLMHLCNL